MGSGGGGGFFDTGGAGGNFLGSRALVGGLFDNSQKQGMDAAQKSQTEWEMLNAPTFDTYNPEAYNPLKAQSTQVADDPMVRSAQMSALAKMGDLSNTGLSDVDQAGYQQARDLGNQMANSGELAAMQNANARGIGGSGMEFANREMANQQGAQRAQQAGLQQAADSARQRALYNQAYSGALGNQRAQDLNLNAQNAGILNQFNMANTNAQNQANQWNTANRNNAQMVNNQNKQTRYEDTVQKVAGESGANQGIANSYAAANAANTANRNQDMKDFGSIMSMVDGMGG